MKWSNHLRMLAVSLVTAFLLSAAPSVQATTLMDHGDSLLQKLKQIEEETEAEREKKQRGDDRDKKRTDVPEGTSGPFLVMAAGALGGALLVWRRKLSTNVL